MPAPRPASDEVAVEVRAMATAPARGAVFSGIVVDGAAGLVPAVGDEVFGAWPAGAGAVTRLVCGRGAVVRKPVALAHAEAVVLAGRGATALRAARLAGARAGDRVLITGASGALGVLVVQIAKAWGWRVTAVCPDRETPLAWDLGADDVHACERASALTGPFAAVIDTDGSVAVERAGRLLGPGGRRVVSRGGAIDVATARGDAVPVEPEAPAGPGELAELAELVERGVLFPIESRAHQEAGDADARALA